MTARRKPGPPVPDHLVDYLNDHAGTWTLFDGQYLTRPDEIPVGYLATENDHISRYAVARLGPDNVRLALFSFVPQRAAAGEGARRQGEANGDRREITDSDCRKRAMQVVEQLNGLQAGKIHRRAS